MGCGAEVAGDGTVPEEELESSEAMEKDLKYIDSAMSSTPHTLAENFQLYMLKFKELSSWQDMTKCQLKTGRPILYLLKCAQW